jgi:hypothetical protein
MTSTRLTSPRTYCDKMCSAGDVASLMLYSGRRRWSLIGLCAEPYLGLWSGRPASSRRVQQCWSFTWSRVPGRCVQGGLGLRGVPDLLLASNTLGPGHRAGVGILVLRRPDTELVLLKDDVHRTPDGRVLRCGVRWGGHRLP